MRKIIIIVTTTLLALTFLLASPDQQAAANSPDIAVSLDGLPVQFDVPPKIKDGRTLVPFRFIAEALHVTVNWDANTGTIIATSGDTKVLLQIGNKSAYVDGSAILLDVEPLLINSRTLIPLRF